MHLGQRILRYHTVASTNDIAWQHREHGLVVIADEQTSGRGQRGNRWHAPPSTSLLLSMQIHHEESLSNKIPLTIWAAVGVCQFIDQFTGLKPSLKWPNDVMLEGKKVCGILVEQRRDWSVVGVGFNINVPLVALKAANLMHAGSLHQFSSQPINREFVTTRLLEIWNDSFRDWIEGTQDHLMNQWKHYAQLIGMNVKVKLPEGQWEGVVEDMNSKLLSIVVNQVARQIYWESVVSIRPSQLP